MDLELINAIQVQPFETSCLERKYLLSIRERHYEVSESVAQLIDIMKSSGSSEEMAVKLSEIKNQKYTKDHIVSFYEKYIAPMLVEQEKEPKGMFLWKTELIPPSIVEIFLKGLKLFFKPAAITIMLLAIITCEILFFTNDMTFSLGYVDVFVIGGILLLYVASSFFHELGHAAACRYFGAKQRGIGFGLYLNFPAFYTDVSDIWKLPRKQRMVVNFAGIYFQTIFLLPFFLIYFITGNNIVKYFIFTINFNFLFTLNPFFKFDGYWIMTDALGVANLRNRSTEFLGYLKDRILHRTVDNRSFLMTIKKPARVVLAIYSIIVNLFFVYYFGYILPRFLKFFFLNFPTLFRKLINEIAVGNMPALNLITGVIGQFLAFALMVYFAYRMLIPIIKKGIGIFKKNNA